MPDPNSVNECDRHDAHRRYHEAQVPPLIQEVAIHVDTVGLGEVFRDHLTDCGQIGRLFVAAILNISDIGVCGFERCGVAHCACGEAGRWWSSDQQAVMWIYRLANSEAYLRQVFYLSAS